MSKSKSPNSKGKRIGNENVNERDGRIHGHVKSTGTPNNRIKSGNKIIQGLPTPPVPDGDDWNE